MTTRSITVRSASPEDLHTIVAFNQAMAVETENRILDPATTADGVRAGLAHPGKCTFFVAEISGAVVGQAMITTEWSDWNNRFFWWIQSVYVSPAHRRTGVFRALHGHIRKVASNRQDVCGLRLYVHRKNDVALDVYRKLGMQLTDYLLLEDLFSKG